MGAVPERLTVNLVPGADFVIALDSKDQTGEPLDWPDTATISLVFNDTEGTIWPATVSGPTAAWNVDKAEVDALLSRYPSRSSIRVRLVYVDGSVDLVWAKGSVTVQ